MGCMHAKPLGDPLSASDVANSLNPGEGYSSHGSNGVSPFHHTFQMLHRSSDEKRSSLASKDSRTSSSQDQDHQEKEKEKDNYSGLGKVNIVGKRNLKRKAAIQKNKGKERASLQMNAPLEANVTGIERDLWGRTGFGSVQDELQAMANMNKIAIPNKDEQQLWLQTQKSNKSTGKKSSTGSAKGVQDIGKEFDKEEQREPVETVETVEAPVVDDDQVEILVEETPARARARALKSPSLDEPTPLLFPEDIILPGLDSALKIPQQETEEQQQMQQKQNQKPQETTKTSGALETANHLEEKMEGVALEGNSSVQKPQDEPQIEVKLDSLDQQVLGSELKQDPVAETSILQQHSIVSATNGRKEESEHSIKQQQQQQQLAISADIRPAPLNNDAIVGEKNVDRRNSNSMQDELEQDLAHLSEHSTEHSTEQVGIATDICTTSLENDAMIDKQNLDAKNLEIIQDHHLEHDLPDEDRAQVEVEAEAENQAMVNDIASSRPANSLKIMIPPYSLENEDNNDDDIDKAVNSTMSEDSNPLDISIPVENLMQQIQMQEKMGYPVETTSDVRFNVTPNNTPFITEDENSVREPTQATVSTAVDVVHSPRLRGPIAVDDRDQFYCSVTKHELSAKVMTEVKFKSDIHENWSEKAINYVTPTTAQRTTSELYDDYDDVAVPQYKNYEQDRQELIRLNSEQQQRYDQVLKEEIEQCRLDCNDNANDDEDYYVEEEYEEREVEEEEQEHQYEEEVIILVDLEKEQEQWKLSKQAQNSEENLQQLQQHDNAEAPGQEDHPQASRCYLSSSEMDSENEGDHSEGFPNYQKCDHEEQGQDEENNQEPDLQGKVGDEYSYEYDEEEEDYEEEEMQKEQEGEGEDEEEDHENGRHKEEECVSPDHVRRLTTLFENRESRQCVLTL